VTNVLQHVKFCSVIAVINGHVYMSVQDRFFCLCVEPFIQRGISETLHLRL
jgi:hypothetical protein